MADLSPLENNIERFCCEISFFGATQFPFWEPPDFLVGIHFGASATIFSHSSMS